MGHAAAEERGALVGTNRDVGAGYGDRVTLGWATMGVTMCGETGVSSGFGSYHGRVLGKRKTGGPRGRRPDAGNAE